MIISKDEPLIMFEVTDPEEIAKYRARRERLQKNVDWLEAHVSEIYSMHRGKCICVAGQELFVADSGPEVIALARSVHPDDDGFLMRYIPLEKLGRIYAHSGALDNL